jgi:hypothetical protein
VFFELSATVLPHEPWTPRGLTWLGQAIDGTIVEAMRVVVDPALLPPPDPRIRWSSGGHLVPFGRTGIAQAITNHLARPDLG